MLVPQRMIRVTIAAPKNLLGQIIDELHDLKVLHIKDHKSNEFAGIGNPLEAASRISEALVKTRSLISAFNIMKIRESGFSGCQVKHEKIRFGEIIKKIASLQAEFNSKSGELKDIETSTGKNRQMLIDIEKLKGIDIPLEYFRVYKSISYFAGYLKNIDNFKNELKSITPKFKIIKSKEKKSDLIVLLVEADKNKEASELLGRYKFSHFNVFQFNGLKGTAGYNFEKLNKINRELTKKSESIKSYIKKLGNENAEFLILSERYLTEELQKAEVPLRFAETRNVFIVTGYVPKENTDLLKKRMGRLKEGIYVEFNAPKKEEQAPVKLDNPKPVNSFEFFLNLYTLPSYSELDPTSVVFLTFPILFGFILGDIGYGLVSLGIFFLLKKSLPKISSFFNILILSSIATIFFGFIFGEFFGFEELGHFEIPHLISRSHDMMGLLFFAIIVGIVHVNIGLILGFVNEKKTHGLMHAINAKMGWIVLELGLFFIAAYFLKWLNWGWGHGVAVLLLAVIMIFKGEGIKGVLEIPSIFSNIISYARLMAIGVTSVMFAIVINEMSEKMFHSSGIMIVAGIIVLLIGHITNIAIGIFGSFLHPLRLHYVEFFSKFYHGGGERYKPFGEDEQATK